MEEIQDYTGKDPYHCCQLLIYLMPLVSLFLYFLKASENQRLPDVFRGYRKRPAGEMVRMVIYGPDSEVYLEPCQTSLMECFYENSKGLNAH